MLVQSRGPREIAEVISYVKRVDRVESRERVVVVAGKRREERDHGRGRRAGGLETLYYYYNVRTVL